MRITYIAAGAAGNYCGACARDIALANGLLKRGHGVTLLPLYTPLRTDLDDPSSDRVFYGGINAYLQQRLSIFRRTPRFVDWLFDRPALLRLVSRFAIETKAAELGEMTVSVLRGSQGAQSKELQKLLDFLGDGDRPDVVNLTNSLLIALAPAIKERLGVRVACTLQGEESFVADLPEPYRAQALDLMREHAAAVDLFIASHAAYAGEMCEYLSVPAARMRVIRPGIELAPYRAARERPVGPFRIGYLSRVARSKGIDLLCDAFRLLGRGSEAHLAVAGQLDRTGRRLWTELSAQLTRDGLFDSVEYVGELDLAGKIKFLRDCSVFCLPSRIMERRGMACLEAMAAGLPVIVPDRGVFPEIIELTGGGLLVEPDNPRAIADAAERLLGDQDHCARLGSAAAAGVEKHFSADAMVEATLLTYREFTSTV